jgi:MtaA/CmuA family methyltransferase
MTTANDVGNSRQFVRDALGGLRVSRPAVGPLAVHYCAKIAGVPIRRYTTDPRVLADCVVRYYETFHPDAVWVSADTWVTAQAMGAAVRFPGDDQPMGGNGDPRVRAPADIGRIPPPNPASQGRFPLMVEAVGRVRTAIGNGACLVACFDQYPFSLACALMGIDQVMLKLTDDRPMVEALMERCLEYTVAYAHALTAAGADMLSGGDSPAGLIGPRSYRDVALPLEKRLIAALRPTGLPVSLHICGNSTSLLADMAASGADVLELDHQVDAARACRAAGPDVAIWGNLDPVAVLARGNVADVRHASRDLLQTVAACGHGRFVLSSGCTIAMETPPENLHAMREVAEEGWEHFGLMGDGDGTRSDRELDCPTPGRSLS